MKHHDLSDRELLIVLFEKLEFIMIAQASLDASLVALTAAVANAAAALAASQTDHKQRRPDVRPPPLESEPGVH
jgi:hypothetical protein